MNNVPTARLCDTEAERKKKLRRGSKLRPISINKGNTYDVSGCLRRLVHQIETGKHGDVTDVVCAVRTIQNNKAGIRTMFFGTSQPEVLHYMACRLEKDTN